MGQTELSGKYKRLRRELEEAYTAPAWNNARIDRLADEIVATELELASFCSHLDVDLEHPRRERAY